MDRIREYIEALTGSDHFRSQVAARHWIPHRPARLQSMGDTLPAPIAALLHALGLARLYTHQCEALASIAGGSHTMVATPTASGKTLIYNLPILQAIAHDPLSRALYIFPLKALAQDQLITFERWSKLAAPLTATAVIYDGDTNAYQRKKIRQKPPNVVMTNPEMVHLALLPYHNQWRDFFSSLRFVVIDEVHTYRGMLGSHMAQVMRRLRRVCAFYGAHPTFVFTSATVANPGQLAGQLTGLEIRTVLESGAPQGGRHIVLIDPEQGASQAALQLLKAALARQLRTIVYTQSRKMAELIAVWAQQRAGRWADKISVYRAGLMPEDRRDIEQRLKDGRLLAVVSTSALELGIDIGDLDLCILVGYPGSMISTWQRSGRVGRQGQESALILIAAENALDKYFIQNPAAFWQGESEAAVINPYNNVALEAHLECAASELPLKPEESWLSHAEVAAAVLRLETSGRLRRSQESGALHARRKRPHLSVHLRGSGERYRIVETGAQAVIGEIDTHRLFRDAHPGAVYLHQGQTYLVKSVEAEQHLVRVHAAQVDYYTRVRSDTDIRIVSVHERKSIGRTQVCIGALNVTDHITAYDRVRNSTGKTLAQVPLDLPPSSFETQGIWFDVPADICALVAQKGFDVMGALHAAEHAAISMMPLLVLADRNDMGGLSTNFHPATGQAAIFIYDGVPGGAGFSMAAFARAADLLGHTLTAIQQCPCTKGCPACVHSPKCGSGNQPIDKAGAALALQQLLVARPSTPSSKQVVPAVDLAPAQIPLSIQQPLRYGVFDLETQLSAQEVGGWHKADLMRVSCGVVYDAAQDQFVVYQEDRIQALIDHLQQLDLVVGFNSKRFDYKVLSGYCDYPFEQLPSLDLLELVYQRLGFRLSLDHLAEATLEVQKSGSGLDALRWWRQGQVQKIIDYCRLDVQITRDLYLFARDNGYLLYRQRDSKEKFRVRILDAV